MRETTQKVFQVVPSPLDILMNIARDNGAQANIRDNPGRVYARFPGGYVLEVRQLAEGSYALASWSSATSAGYVRTLDLWVNVIKALNRRT